MNNHVRMSPEDSAFWRMESDSRRMHSVTLATIEGAEPTLEALTDHVARRIPLVPRFRQRVEEIPFDLGRPMWVDDPAFDVSDHVLEASAGSGAADVDELVSRVVSEPLDRTKPLWQLTLARGVERGRWALVSKVHHSMIDGLFGTDPLAVLIDDAADIGAVPANWDPGPAPRRDELLGQTIFELAVNPVEQYRFARGQARRARRRLIGRTTSSPADDPLGLSGPVGGQRTWSSVSVDMAEIRAVRNRLEANTHELILAVIADSLRELLVSRGLAAVDGGPTNASSVIAIVPVAVAGTGPSSRDGVAAEVVELPVAEMDLISRVEWLHAQTRQAASNPVAIDAQIGITGFPTAALASLGLREATRRGAAVSGTATDSASSRRPQTVVVNVPGPRHELTLLGQVITDIRSAPPLAATVRLAFGVFSYRDTLTFGVTADPQSVPDADIVITGLRSALASLIQRAGD